MMKWNGKVLALVLAAVAIAVAVRWNVMDTDSRLAASSYSQFLQAVRDNKVDSIKIAPAGSGATPATYHMKEGSTARTVLPADYRDALAAMQQASVDIEIKDTSSLRVLVNAAPFLVLLAVWLIMMFKLRRGTRMA